MVDIVITASDLEFDIITDDEFVVVSNVETLSPTVMWSESNN